MMMFILFLAGLGFCISLYTYITERQIKQNPTYKPFCDISDKISCSKPMLSKYSSIFFFSNAIMGMVFYAAVALAVILGSDHLFLALAVLGAAASAFLGYLLYFKIKSLCILCTSLYVINALLLIIAIIKIYR
jgi:vitamin-K-epoxide reductase (warfarin-sensitive)